MDYKQFLDPDFSPVEEDYSSRERVIARCTDCKTNSYVLVSNLKKQIKRLGTHICWSCSCRRSALKRHAKKDQL